MGGRISRLGTGRVWSEMMMVQRFFPAASAARPGVPIGDAMASSTSSLPVRSLFSSSTREVSRPL